MAFRVLILKVGRSGVLLCLGAKQEHLENILPEFPGALAEAVLTAAAGAEAGGLLGRRGMETKCEEVGMEMRTFSEHSRPPSTVQCLGAGGC